MITSPKHTAAAEQITSPRTLLIVRPVTTTGAIRFVFDGGTTQDSADKEGLANLMTGLFDDGAGDLDSDAFQVTVDHAGAEMSFDAQRDGIYGRCACCPNGRTPPPICSGSRLTAPASTRSRSTASAPSGAESTARILIRGRTRGTKESLAGTRPVDLGALHKAAFVGDGLHVAVVGDIDAIGLGERLHELVGDLPQKQAIAPLADVAPSSAGVIGRLRPAADFAAAVFSRHRTQRAGILSRTADKQNTQRLAIYLTSVPGSARKARPAYDIHSSLKAHQHSNALVVTTATRADRAAETLGLIRHVIRDLAETVPTEAKLKASKKYLIGTYATNNLDSSSSIAATLVGSWHRLHQRRAAHIDRPSRGSGEEAAFGRTRHYGGRPARGRQRMGPGSNFAILLPL